MIYGNLEGIKNSYINELEELYNIKVPRKEFITEEIINVMCKITELINREVSVSINRKGDVLGISVGNAESVELPVIDIKEKSLSGVRIIHTHPSGNSHLSVIDISALLKLKLDVMAAIGVEDGKAKDISLGFCGVYENNLVVEKKYNNTIEEVLQFDYLDKVHYIEESIKNSDIKEIEEEKAILVSTDSEEMLDELEELAFACNVTVVYKVLQKKNKIEAATFIGSGKAEEIALLRQVYDANVIIFDDELSGAQVKNLESIIGAKVIDRTTLILDIFARRAKTREAKIQVELAQLKYRSARLLGLGVVMSRTGAGIGTRGPGEKKLEIDKRKIRENIHDLNKELEKIRKNRSVQREKRNKANMPKISLVGYTNAGKSTLRNLLANNYAKDSALNKENVFAENMLFATLDVTTRAIELKDRRIAALTDTVGFVRKLPHDLVAAFKSTLEEVTYSDLLLHVVDGSSQAVFDQIEAVEEVLVELSANDKPQILVINKIDLMDEEKVAKLEEKFNYLPIVKISAKKEINIEDLMEKITEVIPSTMRKVEYLIPYTNSSAVSYIHRTSIVEEEEYLEYGTRIVATVDEKVFNKTANYIKK